MNPSCSSPDMYDFQTRNITTCSFVRAHNMSLCKMKFAIGCKLIVNRCGEQYSSSNVP